MAEVGRLEQQVKDMDEQLEGLYLRNVVTPRQAAQDNLAQQQQLSHSLQQAEDEVHKQQQDLQEMDNDISNLSAQLNKVGALAAAGPAGDGHLQPQRAAQQGRCTSRRRWTTTSPTSARSSTR